MTDKNLLRIILVLLTMSVCGELFAQQVSLKVMSWNVLSFERTDKSGQNAGFPVDDYVTLIKNQGCDVVCLNEFETGSSRMEKEKMSELAAALGMYAYYIKSYPKDVGFYGNVILSKYPIVSSATHLFPYKHYLGEGNYQWNTSDAALSNQYGADQRSVGYADILVPVSDNQTRTVRIVCSHFDHVGAAECRTTQAQQSVEFASLSSSSPAIMCGDLNTTSQTELASLYAAGDHVGVNWVDHIFCFPQGVWTTSFQKVSVGNLSDHDAIVATLSLNQ